MVFGLIGNVIGKVVDEVDEFASNPVGYVVDAAAKPIRDGLEVLQGLTEGELRVKAIARFGADAVVGMGSAELIDLLMS